MSVSAEPLAATRGNLRFRGTPVEKHWNTLMHLKLCMMNLFIVSKSM